jgi:hypothetical protein
MRQRQTTSGARETRALPLRTLPRQGPARRASRAPVIKRLAAFFGVLFVEV